MVNKGNPLEGWDRETLLKQRPFFKRRAAVYRRLANAARASNLPRKKKENYKPLEQAAKKFKRSNIAFLDVAHLIAYAEEGKRIHDKIVEDHKEKRKRYREEKKAYQRKAQRTRDRLLRDYNQFSDLPRVDKDTVTSLISSEHKIEKFFSPKVLGPYFQAVIEKEGAELVKANYAQDEKADNPPKKYMNKFCSQINDLLTIHGRPNDYQLIADLANAFSLSSRKQSYHTIHSRISSLNK